jgi:hypothetical protein
VAGYSDGKIPERLIEVRGFKWPNRSTDVALARFLGEDAFGRWLGVARGDRWWAADGSRAGVFEPQVFNRGGTCHTSVLGCRLIEAIDTSRQE